MQGDAAAINCWVFLLKFSGGVGGDQTRWQTLSEKSAGTRSKDSSTTGYLELLLVVLLLRDLATTRKFTFRTVAV